MLPVSWFSAVFLPHKMKSFSTHLLLSLQAFRRWFRVSEPLVVLLGRSFLDVKG